MKKLLFKIEDSFVIPGRGVILSPGLGDKAKFVKTGTQLVLVQPDKKEIRSWVKAIQMDGDNNMMIDLTVKLPVGTEVWTLEKM